MRKAAKALLFVLAGLALVASIAAYFVYAQLQPMAAGSKKYIRFEPSKPLPVALTHLEGKGFLRNAKVAHLYARFRKRAQPVPEGTYELSPGMTVDELLEALQNPVRNMFRIPETNLSYRTAKLLAKNEIASEEEYNTPPEEP